MASVEDIGKALETSHHAFPVLNSNAKVVGLIPRNYLITLLQYRHFYGSESIVQDDDGKPLARSMSLSAAEMKKSKSEETHALQRKSTLAQYSNFFDQS